MLTTRVPWREISLSVPKAEANGLGSRLLLPFLFTRKSSMGHGFLPVPVSDRGRTGRLLNGFLDHGGLPASRQPRSPFAASCFLSPVISASIAINLVRSRHRIPVIQVVHSTINVAAGREPTACATSWLGRGLYLAGGRLQ
jgi:hypothetical protein